MITFSQCISVFFLAMIELWAAVPTGLAFKLSPIVIVICSSLGAISGALLVLIIGEPLRKWLMSLKKSSAEKPNSTLKKILDKYGIPGLCIIAPLLLGAPLGAAIGLTLKGNKTTIALWLSVSCIVWATIFTLLGTMGISAFRK